MTSASLTLSAPGRHCALKPDQPSSPVAGDLCPAGTHDCWPVESRVGVFLEHAPGTDGVGRKLSQLLLGFLATEVVPLAERLAGLGIDPTPLFATTSGCMPTPWSVPTIGDVPATRAAQVELL